MSDSIRDQFKYANLSNKNAISKLQEIENNSNLSLDEKRTEFELIAFGQTYDLCGLSYSFIEPGHVYFGTISNNILKRKIIKDHCFYKPNDPTLPSIYFHYDRGYLRDFIPESP